MSEKIINYNDELLKISFISPKIVRFHFSRNKVWRKNYSFCIDHEKFGEISFKYKENDKFYSFITEELEVRINKEFGKIQIFDSKGNLILSDYKEMGYKKEANGIYSYKEIKKEEAFLGFGERLGPLNKKGQRIINWNTDESNHEFNRDPLYQSHPFFLAWSSERSYGLFWDSTSFSYFDMGMESKYYYYFFTEDEELDYYFIYGPTPKEVIEGYTYLVGRCYMPPLWALGFHQSRWSYDSEEKVYKVARLFREKQIPCDVLYLDIDYMDGYRVFTIDRRKFPNFEKMLRDLKEMGFRIVLIIDPGVKVDKNYGIYREGIENGYFCQKRDGEVFTGYVWPGKTVFPDFLKEKVRKWWGEKHREFLEQGVAGFWNDMNEPSNFSKIEYYLMRLLFHVLHFKEPPDPFKPKNFAEKIRRIKAKTLPEDVLHGENNEFSHGKIHNVYGLMMNRATFDGFRKIKPDARPFILSRSGFSGIQKYSAVWCGDNKSTWENLYSSIVTLQNLGISGVPFVGEDVGGFWRDSKAELFARWIELGIFYPFFRVHTAMNTKDQEPWSFGEEIEKIAREYISLRYKLIPYIYSLFYEAKEKGIPLIRSLILEFPKDREMLNHEDEFMFGPFILVAPIYEKEKREKEVYLPKGYWYDFYTNKRYRGEGTIKVYAPLNKIPIFIKEGSIIPMWNVQNYVGEKIQENLYLRVYPGEGRFLYYEDDGFSWNYEKGEYNLIEFSTFSKDGGQYLRIKYLNKGYKTSIKNFIIESLKKKIILKNEEGEFLIC
ncbi:MAG: glycoside hydrolase family 31 protein [Dictyoglomaceae bacterium]